MQHQFWITKKTVQRKLGSKEDEHIVSSDAELDAKIEVFKSISTTSIELSKIVEQYHERLCILSQEESVFGRFLKEAGKRSKTTGQTIANTGKAVSYCGQQRMCVRVPLQRLQQEVDVFRCRAVTDTQSTISAMEKERTEYRAALEWIKSASNELDPDTGRGIEKFRTAQTHVRNAKQSFDCLSMNSIQKIDLLAAARCSMFSHVLIAYMTELKNFAYKSNTTFRTISESLEQRPKYDFCILRDLTQQEGNQENHLEHDTSSFDKDQALFFADDFVDKNESNESDHKDDVSNTEYLKDNLIKLNNNHDNDDQINLYNQSELLSESETCGVSRKKAVNIFPNVLNAKPLNSSNNILLPKIQNYAEGLRTNETKYSAVIESSTLLRSETKKITNSNPWIELFADLDPLSNIEAFDLKINGNHKNIQQT